jgi:hypothetical protein
MYFFNETKKYISLNLPFAKLPFQRLKEFHIANFIQLMFMSVFHFEGLQFLSLTPLAFHGRLKSTNCYVDTRWLVKLSGFGQRELKRGEAVNKSEEQVCKGTVLKAYGIQKLDCHVINFEDYFGPHRNISAKPRHVRLARLKVTFTHSGLFSTKCLGEKVLSVASSTIQLVNRSNECKHIIFFILHLKTTDQ